MFSVVCQCKSVCTQGISHATIPLCTDFPVPSPKPTPVLTPGDVPTEARAVCKRVVGIPVECFLVAACLDGQGRGSDSQCRDCEQGTYRAVGQEDNCTACPDGWTTAASKSVNITQCSIGKILQEQKIGEHERTKNILELTGIACRLLLKLSLRKIHYILF